MLNCASVTTADPEDPTYQKSFAPPPPSSAVVTGMSARDRY